MDVNVRKTLSTVSKLVSSGQHKAAIDLLLDYLELDPNSSTALNVLGRAYLLDNQPEKAVIQLKRSLEITQSNSNKNNNLSMYQSDDFDDNDMAFVETQTEVFAEDIYSLEFDESAQSSENKDAQKSSNDRHVLSPGSVKTGEFESKNDKKRVQIICRSNRKVTLNNYVVPSLKHDDLNGVMEDIQNSMLPHTDEESSLTILPLCQDSSIDEGSSSDWVDDEGFEFFENEQLFLDGLFEDGNDDQDEEALDEIAPTSFLSQEEPGELIWDGFEDLDEFDELAHREAGEEVQDDGKISREARARQVAVEVLNQSDWDQKHLSLLQQIFIENGWSAARKAIEREIEKGVLPEELTLARKIRRLWLGNEQFWMAFYRIKYNAQSQQTDASYKCMSWPESLRIIRCFPFLPDIEEVYIFFDETYDHWYNSKDLRRSFKAFFQFLKYRTGSMNRTLPGNCVFSFLDMMDESSGIDSDNLYDFNTIEKQILLDLGLQLNQWPRPPENKIKTIKEQDE